MRMLRPGIAKAFGYALISTAGLCALIVVGSRRLTHFDSALVATPLLRSSPFLA